MRVRHRLALVATGGALLLSSAFVMATRQSAVEQRLRDLLTDTVAAPCTFETAEFGFLDGLRVTGLTIFDPDDPLGPPLVTVGEARVDYHAGLLDGGPRITAVILQGPRVRFALGPDGTPPLSRLVRPVDAPRDEPGPPLPTIRVFGGTLELEGPPLLAPGGRLELRGIRADVVADEHMVRVPRLTATSDDIGTFTAAATSRDDGRVLEITARLEDMDLTQLRSVSVTEEIAAVLDEHDVSGRVVAEGALRIEEGSVVDASGAIEITDAAFLFTIPERPGLPPPKPIRIRVDAARVGLAEGSVTLEDLAGEVFGAPLSARGKIDLADVPGAPTGRTARVDVTALLQGVRVGRETVPYLHANLQRVQRAFDLAGTADVTIDVAGDLPKPRVDAHLDVRDASASYLGYANDGTGRRRGFPWRVTDLDGTVDVRGARVEFAAKGRHGVAPVSVTGLTNAHPSGFPLTDVRIAATDVPIDDDLYAGFQDRAERTLGPWRPTGVAGRIDVHVVQDPDIDRGGTATQVHVELDGRAGFTPDHLPVPLRRARGKIRVLEPEIGGERVSRVEIEGVSAEGDGFVLTAVDGTVLERGEGGRDETVRIQATVDDMAGAFREGVDGSITVPDGVKRAVALLDPRGPADLDIRLRDDDGRRDDRVDVVLRGVHVAGWEGIPLDARSVRGRVAYANDRIVTPGLDLEVLGAAVHVVGDLDGLSVDPPRPTLDIAADALPLDDRLRRALGTLADGVADVWTELRPQDDLRADVVARVRPPSDAAPQLTFELDELAGGLDVLGLTLRATGGDVAFDGSVVRGAATAALGGGVLDVASLRFDTRTSDAELRLGARGLRFADDLVPLLAAESARDVDATLRPTLLHAEGLALGWDAATRRLTASGLLSLRPAARDGADDPRLPVEGDITLRDTVLEFADTAGVVGSGTARLSNAKLEPGIEIADLAGDAAFTLDLRSTDGGIDVDVERATTRLAGFPLTDLSFRIATEGRRLRVEDLAAMLHGGAVTGRFNRGGERLAYRGAFSVIGADLARAAADAGREGAAGLLDLDVRFRNRSGEADALEGAGSVSLSGAGVRVPFLTAALEAVNGAFLGASEAEGGFQDGRAAFDVRGTRLLVRELEVAGPRFPLLFDAALELRDGRGAVDLAAERLDLVVYPRIRFAALDIDPTGIIDRVFGLAQLVFRRLRIEGTLRNPRTSWEVISGDLEEEFRPRPLPIGEIRDYGAAPW